MPPIPSSRVILTDLLLQLAQSSQSPPLTPSAAAANPLKAHQEHVREIIVALEYLVPGGVTAALNVLDKGLVTRYCLRAEDRAGLDVGSEEPVEKIPASEPSVVPAVEREIPGTPNGSDSELSSADGDDAQVPIQTPAPAPAPAPPTSPATVPKSDDKYAYYVRSEQPPRSRWSKKPPRPTQTYSVRPTAWFCTCPAFLFAAFAAPPEPVATSRYPEATERNRRARRRWEAEEFARVSGVMETHGWVWGGRMLGVQAPPVCKHLVACVLAENCGGLFMPFVKRVEMGLEEMVGMSVDVRRI